jgi:hypothetical protein
VPFWSVAVDTPEKAPSNRGKCLDVFVSTTWSSHFVNFKVNVKGGLDLGVSKGDVLHQGDEPLRAHYCRPK